MNLMKVKAELYGLTVEIDRVGYAPVRLTFEEVYPKRFSSQSSLKYYCLIEIGLYERKKGMYGKPYVSFEKVGSFEINDWFNFNKDLIKRNKLKNIIGVLNYNELVKVTESHLRKDLVSKSVGVV